MKWLKPLLAVVAIGHIVLGLYFLYAVDVVAGVFGFELLNTGARGELRALVGGLGVALGALILRGALGGRFGRQWLYAAGVVYTGLLTARIVSLGMDGLAVHTIFAGLYEAAMAVLFFWAGAEIGRSALAAVGTTESQGPGEPIEAPATPSAVATPAPESTGSLPAPDADSMLTPDTDSMPASEPAASEDDEHGSDGSIRSDDS